MTPTIPSVLGVPEHPQMALVQRRVLALYTAQRNSLVNVATEDLRELLRRAEDARNDLTFSLRTAAEINRAACEVLLAARAAGSERGKL